VRDLRPDVAGLQEVYDFQEQWLLRAVRGYTSVGAGRTDGTQGERCPVFVRRGRLAIEAAETRWFSSEPERAGTMLDGARFPRIATLVTMSDAVTRHRFAIANVHLDERRRANRVFSVELLLTWLEPTLPWVVVGDFNATPAAPELDVLRAAGYESVLGADAPGTAHNFTGRLDGNRIDHVLVKPGEWQVDAARVVTTPRRRRLPSDHWPVVADLNLRQ
jgi:endonuclease/exonuclease/phosphatase family metal-dependent hydrolase